MNTNLVSAKLQKFNEFTVKDKGGKTKSIIIYSLC